MWWRARSTNLLPRAKRIIDACEELERKHPDLFKLSKRLPVTTLDEAKYEIQRLGGGSSSSFAVGHQESSSAELQEYKEALELLLSAL